MQKQCRSKQHAWYQVLRRCGVYTYDNIATIQPIVYGTGSLTSVDLIVYDRFITKYISIYNQWMLCCVKWYVLVSTPAGVESCDSHFFQKTPSPKAWD